MLSLQLKVMIINDAYVCCGRNVLETSYISKAFIYQQERNAYCFLNIPSQLHIPIVFPFAFVGRNCLAFIVHIYPALNSQFNNVLVPF